MSYKFTEMKMDDGKEYKFTEEQLIFADLINRANVGYNYLELLIKDNAFKNEEDLLLAKKIMSNMGYCIDFSGWCGGLLPKDTVKDYLDMALDNLRRIINKDES